MKIIAVLSPSLNAYRKWYKGKRKKDMNYVTIFSIGDIFWL